MDEDEKRKITVRKNLKNKKQKDGHKRSDEQEEEHQRGEGSWEKKRNTI